MRYHLIDELRGFTLISMILYHACWDLVYMFHVKAPWYETRGAYYWQQSICWTFIFLSGFCWHFGRNKLQHGIKIFLGGAAITLVTLLVMPEDRVVFGVLTFLGSAALIVTFLEDRLRTIPASPGLIISLFLFILTKQINTGIIGIGPLQLIKLPDLLYQNYFTAYLGFPPDSFFSTDYFSVLPWIFLYLAGFYTYILMKEKNLLYILEKGFCPALRVPGKHSFLIYMIHQPVIYGILWAGSRIGMF